MLSARPARPCSPSGQRERHGETKKAAAAQGRQILSSHARVRDSITRARGVALVTAATLLAWGTLVSSDVGHAHSHQNADSSSTSWYPPECCHDRDCRPVAHVMRASQGLWMTTVDGLTVLVGPKNRRLPSHDMRWHICINPDVEAAPDTIMCVFEPPDS